MTMKTFFFFYISDLIIKYKANDEPCVISLPIPLAPSSCGMREKRY